VLVLTTPPAVHAAQLPDCLVGNFRLTNFDGLIRTAMPEVQPSSITLVSGDAVTSRQSSGAYENSYRQLTISTQLGELPMTMTFDGSDRGTMRQTGQGSLTLTPSDASFTMTLDIQGQSQQITLEGPSDISVDLTYECLDDRVITTTTIPTGDGGEPHLIRSEEVRMR
jgi:hypothetical protein